MLAETDTVSSSLQCVDKWDWTIKIETVTFCTIYWGKVKQTFPGIKTLDQPVYNIIFRTNHPQLYTFIALFQLLLSKHKVKFETEDDTLNLSDNVPWNEIQFVVLNC